MRIKISEAIMNEALKASEFRPLMQVGRELAMERINQIWPRLEAQADSKNRSADKKKQSGDRLYFNLEKSGEEFEISSKDKIVSYLNNANYEVVNFKDGLVRKKDDKNITSFGKVLTMLSKKDPEARDLLNAYNNEKSVMALGDDYVMVISRHPYDIGGMSTDRAWTSCVDLRGERENKKYIPIDVEKGTIVSYLLNKNDLNIKNPVARISIKPFINKSNEKNVLYGIEQDSVKYGRQHEGYVKKLINVLDIAQEEKTGIFKIDEKLYPDNKNKRFIGDFSKEDIEDFKLKVQEVRDRLTIEILSKKHPWLLYADVEDVVIGGFSDVFVWYNGLWKGGVWQNGEWFDGTWEDGKWEDGKWKGGVWQNGVWENGWWQNGVWENGTWKGGQWDGGEWKNGVWENGLWKGGTWKGGTWRGGNIWNGSEYVKSSQPPK